MKEAIKVADTLSAKILAAQDDLLKIPINNCRHYQAVPAFNHSDEPLFWLLADWRGEGKLAEMRAVVMDRGIQAKDDGASEWNQYPQLAATPEAYYTAKWNAADKVIRHCAIQVSKPETEPEGKTKGENASHKFQNTGFLLAHATDALDDVSIHSFSTCPCTAYDPAFRLRFDNEIQLLIFNQAVDANDGIEKACAALNKKIVLSNGNPPLFYTVIDVDGSDPDLETEAMLRYLYGKLAGDSASHEAVATKYIVGNSDSDSRNEKNAHACMTGVAGIVGMEGALFVRNLKKFPNPKNSTKLTVALPDSPLFNDDSNDSNTHIDGSSHDELWGGSIFQLFLISIFQRKRLDVAAKVAANHWSATTKKSSEKDDIGNQPNRTSGATGEQHEKNDIGKQPNRTSGATSEQHVKDDIDNQLKQMMHLDNTWMYQEMAARTDIDRIYRTYRDALDIPEMWMDIRDQMARSSDYLERKSTKNVEKIITVLTMISLPLAFFAALVTVTGITSDSAYYQLFGVVGVLLLLIAVARFLIPLLNTLSIPKFIMYSFWVSCFVLLLACAFFLWELCVEMYASNKQ